MNSKMGYVLFVCVCMIFGASATFNNLPTFNSMQPVLSGLAYEFTSTLRVVNTLCLFNQNLQLTDDLALKFFNCYDAAPVSFFKTCIPNDPLVRKYNYLTKYLIIILVFRISSCTAFQAGGRAIYTKCQTQINGADGLMNTVAGIRKTCRNLITFPMVSIYAL